MASDTLLGHVGQSHGECRDIENSRGESTIALACNECRRRKARCSRELPVCSQCLQYRRYCLYERPTRSPLTRKHLTEVEESLRIAKQLIRDRLPNVDLSLELKRARNGAMGENFSDRPTSGDDETARFQRVKRPRGKSSEALSPRPTVSYPHDSNDTESDIFNFGLKSVISPPEDSSDYLATDISPTVLADNANMPNMHGLGYEWDEQHDGARSCIDGMAALSIDNEQPGYLGLASSAALLHLIQSYSSDPFSAAENSNRPLPMAQETKESLAVNLQREISSQKIECYIADYFNTYHISYPLVHQGLFMAQYHKIVPRPQTG